jgi:PAS domain S-box-containing protein
MFELRSVAPELEVEVQDRAGILIVDDRPENIGALKAILTRPDYNLVSASSGEEALLRLLKQDYAVVLLDVLMPGMSGLECAKLIRQREVSRHLPIIFMSAAADDVGVISEGYSAGAVDYLLKPIDATIVRAKVAVFVDLYRKARQIKRQEEHLREAERLRGEEALRESEAEFEATFEQAPCGIAHISTGGQCLRVNERFTQLVGYSRDDLRRLRVQELTHRADVTSTVEAFRSVLQGRTATVRREARFLHKGGQPVWVTMRISLLRQSTGRPKAFILVAEDVTNRRHEEEARRFLGASSAVLLSSLEYSSTLDQVARLALPLFGQWALVELASASGDSGELIAVHADPEKLSGFNDRHHALPAGTVLAVAQCLRGPTAIDDLEEPAPLRPEAEQRWLDALKGSGVRSLIVAPMAARGRPLGTMTFAASAPAYYTRTDLAVLADLAQRAAFAVENARLYEEAQDAIRARDEFLSIASHELRTPLTPLQLLLQGLLAERRYTLDEIPVPKLRNALQRSERQVRRLNDLITNLLDVSRIKTGLLDLNKESSDLADIVRDVAQRFGETATKSGSSIELGTLVPARGEWDRLRLEQVITNLLANAIKYGRGKPIEVALEESERCFALIVRDHGIGIERSYLERIFERFERAPSSRSYGGLGLGLYISSQIVEAHGGSIEVESEPVRGSTFTVRLPKAPLSGA